MMEDTCIYVKKVILGSKVGSLEDVIRQSAILALKENRVVEFMFADYQYVIDPNVLIRGIAGYKS